MILRQTQNIRLSNYGPHRHKVDIGSYIVRVCDESCVSLYTCLLVYGAHAVVQDKYKGYASSYW
jgi:hypothetical protein